MFGFFESLPFGFIVFYKGWVSVWWEFFALTCAGHIIWFIARLVARANARSRAQRLREELERSDRRLRLIQEQLRGTRDTLRQVFTRIAGQMAPLHQEGSREMPRLMLNQDGSITEH